MLIYRLTDPVFQENFISGSSDGSSKIDVALPKNKIKKQTWMILMFGYITIFTIIVPIYLGLWWTQSQKTNEGLYCSTAFKFFSAAAHKKKLEFAEMITLLSERDEIVEVVKSYRKLEIEKLLELYLTLPAKREIYISSNPSVLLSFTSNGSPLKSQRCYYMLISIDALSLLPS
jgi:preprotein translocase subunit Sec63